VLAVVFGGVMLVLMTNHRAGFKRAFGAQT